MTEPDLNQLTAQPTPPAAPSPQGRFAAFAHRFGLLPVIFIALPTAAFLWLEIRPDTFTPITRAILPMDNAVRAVEGPGEAAPDTHLPTPAVVKGIYVSAFGAGDRRLMGGLIDLVDRTELNAMVIDIKEGRGELAFRPKSAALQPYAAAKPALGDLPTFLKPLKEKKIYTIARDFVFQDPTFAERMTQWAVQRQSGGIWRDRKGIPWLDAGCAEVWKYNVAVAQEAYDAGFDEIQFDYIRFPTDGDLKSMVFPCFPDSKEKWQQMGEFFSYLDHELRVRRKIPISVDLFGLTMDQADYDLGIGQRLRDALPHFDFISPMTYPSHYASGFEGFVNPADHPYEVVRKSMSDGQRFRAGLQTATTDGAASASAKLGAFRPWLQAFDLGAVYDRSKIQAQISAAMENGASGWLLWNASNRYSAATLEPEPAK